VISCGLRERADLVDDDDAVLRLSSFFVFVLCVCLWAFCRKRF
jgi:hypothetical protein